MDVPQFSEEVLALDGKEITITGYIIPEGGYKSHREFILSSLPYNLCYFCGGAGIETVMQVTCTKGVRYTDEPITIKGKLMLNGFDSMQLIYILTEARQVD